MEEFDEAKAVKAINDALVNAGRKPYDDDEVLNVIDMIWDYYEENGLLDIDNAFDDEDDEEDIAAELTDYVKRMLKKDKESVISLDDVEIMVEAELAYEDSTLE